MLRIYNRSGRLMPIHGSSKLLPAGATENYDVPYSNTLQNAVKNGLIKVTVFDTPQEELTPVEFPIVKEPPTEPPIEELPKQKRTRNKKTETSDSSENNE